MSAQSTTAALPAAFVEEGAAARWGRRAVSLPAYLLSTIAVVGLLPVLMPLAVLFDLLHRRRFTTIRCVAMLAVYLLCESAGILASGFLWLARGIGGERDPSALYELQRRWAGALFGAARALFGLRLEVEGAGEIDGAPLLIFIRHASLADTLLPANLIAAPHGYRLLYVLKRELLWDACLDLVGNRLPNVFVRRASGDSTREIDAIRRLALGLQARQGVLIYPEGTRFTPAKRERALARLAEGRNSERLEQLGQLRHVLPPHLGGPLALLESAARADVLFVAHTGLEGAATASDVWNGKLVGRTVRVKFHRVARQDVPSARAERIAWLDREWARIDEWIEACRARG
jgi:1-acyl-sn-glycerol-3-phosphate acyltransferase